MTRWHVLALLIVCAAALEHLFAARARGPGSILRLRTNLISYAINSGIGIVLAPALAVLLLSLLGRPSWGGVEALQPAWLSWLLAFVVLDLSRYLVHRLFHLPGLWRVHASHHSDDEVDWSTGLRHHPLEVVTAAPIYALNFGLSGLGDAQVLTMSTVALCWDVFSHANLRLPASLSRLLGAVVITPAIHGVHHSTNPVDSNSNFGSVLSLWDRALGTYRDPARAPAAYGLDYADGSRPDRTLMGLLRLPFQNEKFRATAAQPQLR